MKKAVIRSVGEFKNGAWSIAITDGNKIGKGTSKILQDAISIAFEIFKDQQRVAYVH